MHRIAVSCVIAFALAGPARAAQPQFWRLESAREFLEGDAEGLSIDSDGRLRLAPAARLLHDTETPYVWALTRDAKGTLYAGTGNDGKVFRVDGQKASLFYDAPELEVHALAIGADGRLYAATSPDGKVYAIDAAGKAEAFFDPAERYVWALAFDPKGNLLVATGAEGRIHRVDRQGKDEVIFTSSETHITALAVDKSGTIYAGSAPGGIVYRIDTDKHVFVLHDSPYREVKAIDVGTGGSVYAAVIDGKERDEQPPRPAVAGTAPPTLPAGEVTVTESFAVLPPSTGPGPLPTPRPMEAGRVGAPKGGVLRLMSSGEVDTLWTSTEETPHSLVATEDGAYVGTGNKGKLYRVKDDRTWTMVSALPVEQVTGLQKGSEGGVLLATSNPGKLYLMEGRPGSRGTFTSAAKDTDTVSAWGRLRWQATRPEGTDVEVQTRSGNTGSPDSTWSEWSPAYRRPEGDAVTSPRARFLQVRMLLAGKDGRSPILESVTTAYLQRNLRPQVQTVTVHPPGEVFQKPLSVSGEPEILGLETGPGDARSASQRPQLPPTTSYSRRLYQKGIQTFSWKAEDPNNDTLVYEVHYRPEGETRFRLLRKGLTDAVLAWDTSTVPNGRYVVRITASDSLSNPEALALSGVKESVAFDVDNTPPTVTTVLNHGKPMRIRAVVRDDGSLVRRADYSVDGGRWQEIHPVDGINDALEESYEITLEELPATGPHIVVVRASDLLGNLATTRVEVP